MKPPKGIHRLRLHRVTLRSCAYLLTAVTAERRQLFNYPEAAKIVSNSLAHFHERDYVHNFAWVVMPDHIHWLLQLRYGTLDNLVRRFKSWTGYRVRRSLPEPPPQVWARGFHDRCVRPGDCMENLVDYVVLNPVRKGIVDEPGEYPYLYADSEVLGIRGKEPKRLD